MLRGKDPDDVYCALVFDLSKSIVPTCIMGATLVGVSVLSAIEIGVRTYLPLIIFAAATTSVKVAFIQTHRRFEAMGPATLAQTKRLELGHAVTTWGMALSVGALGATMFQSARLELHMIATALLFGYCAGIVSRVSIRPRIAASAIILASLPCLISTALLGDMPHVVMALIFLVFLIGSMETVAHVHRNAAGHISTRLRMSSIARSDPLTGLLNRFGLREQFEEVRQTSRGKIVLHAFDLDRFKQVNDRHGHSGGDQVLVQIGVRLRATLVNGEILARVGGDEFVVIQPDVRDELASRFVAEGIHDVLTKPYDLDDETKAVIGISLGYVAMPASLASLEGLLRDADQTSYLVKRDGGGVRSYLS